jgi:hypothetical protein
LESRINSLIAGRDRGASVNQSEEGFDAGNLLLAIFSDLRKQSKASEVESELLAAIVMS